ncbi:MAG: PilZ domain-containing protein [Nitrospiraceae bacterium]|nr:MAG: PilZ domain-containing protein [Nitrospiraceae bacterium]UCH44645.1 MAG: PilZ domain-containing protein [Nitrospiraceae bacterium]
MDKRDFKRIETSLESHCSDLNYFGTVTNISGNGMFIRSPKINFPLASQFEISIPYKEEILNVPVIIKRLTKSNGYYDGMGVKIINLQKKYLDLLIRLNAGSQP